MKIHPSLTFIALAGALFAVAPSFSATDSAAYAAESAQTQAFVVKIGSFTNDLHSCVMALKVADMLTKKKQVVSLFLNLEGVRLADKRANMALTWGGHGPSVGELYDQLVAKGVTIIVCPHCAEVEGIKRENLRAGAKLGDENSITEMFMKADKIIDY
ncbi:MAG: DsrE family protein [Xanthomonadaceae bacterium]|nr:DsrE family protein [Xanthomonadaceae bacterium]